MTAIETQNLRKTYSTKVKAGGLRASFRALVKPERKEIEAIKNISLKVERGEILACFYRTKRRRKIHVH